MNQNQMQIVIKLFSWLYISCVYFRFCVFFSRRFFFQIVAPKFVFSLNHWSAKSSLKCNFPHLKLLKTEINATTIKTVCYQLLTTSKNKKTRGLIEFWFLKLKESLYIFRYFYYLRQFSITQTCNQLSYT